MYSRKFWRDSLEPIRHGVSLTETIKNERLSFVYPPLPCQSWSTHRSQHLNALCEVPNEGHDGHLLHEPLDLAELHHEAVLIRQALQGLPLPLVETEHFDLILSWQEPHQTLNKVNRECLQVKPETRVAMSAIYAHPIQIISR